MSLADEDLMMLLRNYGRLKQAGSRMFQRWSEEATDPEMKSTLTEFSEIEHQQANAIVLHLAKLEGKMSDGPVPLEEAINLYLDQIDVLPTLGERLRFNHTVMTTLERPVVMRALVES